MMNWRKRHSNWTQFSSNGVYLMLVLSLLSVSTSCVMPVSVGDNQPVKPQSQPLVDTSNTYKSDNTTYYGIDGTVEYNKSFTYDFSNPNKRYVVLDISDSLRNRLGYNSNFLICAGGDGNPIAITNNPNAVDATLDEIEEFIRVDDTDDLPYIEGKFTCGDYAKRVHDNAERQGIKCGIVTLILQDKEDNHTIHAWNIFPIYGRNAQVCIDCTNGLEHVGWYGDSLIIYSEDLKTFHTKVIFRNGEEVNEYHYNDFEILSQGIVW